MMGKRSFLHQHWAQISMHRRQNGATGRSAALLISAGTEGPSGRSVFLMSEGNKLGFVVRRSVIARQCHPYNQFADQCA